MHLLARLLLGRNLLPSEMLAASPVWRPILALLGGTAPAGRLAVLDRLTARHPILGAAIEKHRAELITLAQVGGAA